MAHSPRTRAIHRQSLRGPRPNAARPTMSSSSRGEPLVTSHRPLIRALSMTRTARLVPWAVIAALFLTDCSRRVDAPTPPRGVVLITLDTTRADRLSPYGLMDVSMPHLDRLAREGVVFDQATT